MAGKVIRIRATGMGALTRAVPVDPTIHVEERWGRTHGEAMISGVGRYLLIDISNLGNHRCQLIDRDADGGETILEEAGGKRFCPLCDVYAKGVR